MRAVIVGDWSDHRSLTLEVESEPKVASHSPTLRDLLTLAVLQMHHTCLISYLSTIIGGKKNPRHAVLGGGPQWSPFTPSAHESEQGPLPMTLGWPISYGIGRDIHTPHRKRW